MSTVKVFFCYPIIRRMPHSLKNGCLKSDWKVALQYDPFLKSLWLGKSIKNNETVWKLNYYL